MAEQFALNERLRKGRAIQRNKGAIAPTAVVVKGFCDELFSGSAFAGNQHRGPAVRDLFDLRVDFLHPLALADEVVEGIALDDLRPELFHFAFERLRTERPVDDNA
jgi:hypothetical protein